MLKILPLAEAEYLISAILNRLETFERESSARSAEITRKVFGEPLTPVQVVDRIVSDVRRRGDDAVIEYTLKLDGVILTPDLFRVDLDKIPAVPDADAFLSAVEFAAANVREYQKKMLVDKPVRLSVPGRKLWRKTAPVSSAACYVPGGLAPYPSTVIMSAVPAQVAGVRRVVVVSPPRKTEDIDPRVLLTCKALGVDEVYRIGGVQAIAAMAFGTETIPRVDKIVGPGNLFVMLAKKAVYGHVDIDMFAGPSEILVIADAKANAKFVAADLLSQAEHDEMASSILVTDSRELAEKVAAEIEKQLPLLAREQVARASIDRFGVAIIVPDMPAATHLANTLAPEHLELLCENADAIADEIHNAGAVFVGKWTPEAVGDYVAGSSHILPTGGTARFFSGLSASSFMRSTSFVKYSRTETKKAQAAIEQLAKAEGYDAHLRSAQLRK